MAMYVALTGAMLNPHDAVELGLATHYVRSEDVLSLLNELRCAPPGYLDVPLSRRALAPPGSLASLFADDIRELLDASLLTARRNSAGAAPS